MQAQRCSFTHVYKHVAHRIHPHCRCANNVASIDCPCANNAHPCHVVSLLLCRHRLHALFALRRAAAIVVVALLVVDFDFKNRFVAVAVLALLAVLAMLAADFFVAARLVALACIAAVLAEGLAAVAVLAVLAEGFFVTTRFVALARIAAVLAEGIAAVAVLAAGISPCAAPSPSLPPSRDQISVTKPADRSHWRLDNCQVGPCDRQRLILVVVPAGYVAMRSKRKRRPVWPSKPRPAWPRALELSKMISCGSMSHMM